MENDILDALTDVGYTGPLLNPVAFAKALEAGPKSLEFTKLVHILAEEFKQLCNLEETVSMMDNPDESSSFLLELSFFLKELGCPYKRLITGHISSRLQTIEDRLLLLDYLVSELMAARMVNVDQVNNKKSSGMEIVMQESATAKCLKETLILLKFNKPPPNITPQVLFAKLESKLKETIQKEGVQLVGKPLYNKALSEKDWKQLEVTFTEMFEEYRCRRETLITRMECTIQSCEWSDRLVSKRDAIQSAYRPKRDQLKVKPDVKLADFLAARTSLLQIEKTSSASVRQNTQCDVNKVLIGRVPDRGGRPNEQQPPPPEMPSWQQRTAPQGGGGGGRGGRGGSVARGGQGSYSGGQNGGRGDQSGQNGQNGGRGGQSGQNGGRGGQSGQNGGRDGGRGGGRGGRVQGGYNQGDQARPHSNQRNYQTYEVPPGGYSGQSNHNQSYSNGQDAGRSQYGYNQNYQTYDNNYNQGYTTAGGSGGYNSGGYNSGGYSSGYQSNQAYNNQGQGYNHYQNEHDDRTRVRGYQGRR